MSLATAPVLLAGLLTCSVAFAADANGPQQTVAIWPDQAPGEKGDIGPEREQPPKQPTDTTIRITDVTQPTLTIFRPKPETDTGAAVIIFPGGGYSILAFNKEGTEVAQWLNTLGVTGMVLKYRVPVRKGLEKYAAPLQDAQRAVGLVRNRASEWGLDPKRIGVLGFSAGGHLAATLSNNFDKRTYSLADDADRTSCRPDFTLLLYPAYLVLPKQLDKLAPELKVTGNTPTTFMAMTEDDGIHVECCLAYYLALKQNKVPAEMHLYPAGGHGYGLRPSEYLVSTWPQRAEQWLRSRGLLERAK
ncbi:MAG TPA: alpha/beta hydrolase [Pirellulales bacterium]|jgi:acetyl esterase/lipase|nr:alpha/beta hydrolase [Pirellulales bacterium]